MARQMTQKNTRRPRGTQRRARRARAILALIATGLVWAGVSLAQLMPPAPGEEPADATVNLDAPDPSESVPLKFFDAPLEALMDEYADRTGRTVLYSPGLPTISVTLRTQTDMSNEECLKAIRTVLAMNNIALLHVGEKFVKVVQANAARREPMDILRDEALLPEAGDIVSRLFVLNYAEIEAVQTAIAPLLHAYGQINPYPEINALLITDNSANINRIQEMIELHDRAPEQKEEPHFLPIRHAKASEIQAMLEKIMGDEQGRRTTTTTTTLRRTGPPGVVRTISGRELPGVQRPGVPALPEPEAEQTVETTVEMAARGIIRGTTRIIADDRSNVLIIITRPENMDFFQLIVKALDVEMTREVEVKVLRLEYSEAKAVADILNNLIESASAAADQPAPRTDGEPAATGEGATLRDYVARPEPAESPLTAMAKSRVGELSKENIKILSDERTNALIIMASRSDMARIEEIVRDMDIMLSQVRVEAVILEINLDDTIESGVDWVQRAFVISAGTGNNRPAVAFAGAGGGGHGIPRSAATLQNIEQFPTSASGLSYFLTFFDINVDAIIRAAAGDSRTRILSSPTIMTLDNKEATIDVATLQYFFKGTRYVTVGGTVVPEADVERQNVGIRLRVKPSINTKGFVVMNIEQEISNVSGEQTIRDTKWPIVTTRKLTSDVAIRSGDTIMMGGLVQNTERESTSKVPLLGDIPLIGRLFRHQRNEDLRSEVVVFVTTYVLDTPQALEADALRARLSTGTRDMWQRGWSDSRLAAPIQTRYVDEHGEPLPDDGENLPGARSPEQQEFIRQRSIEFEERMREMERIIEE